MSVRFFYVVLLIIGLGHGASAQVADTPAYLKSPVLPAFFYLLPDSSDRQNTFLIQEGRPTVFIYFSPDCDHCEMMITELLSKMDSMRTADFYLLTFSTLPMLKAFADKHHFKSFKNIHWGKDYSYFFPSFFATRYVPFIAIYDRKKKLVTGREGGMPVPELIAVLGNL